MRIKPKDIEIDPNLPDYPFDHDLLDRKEEIENLTQIVCNVEDPLVLAINAPWGTGKTTFVKLWCAYLEQQGLNFICFNAWETDFAEDPLIPLVSELGKWIDQKKGYQGGEWNKFIKQVMPKLAKRVAVTSVKLATHGVIDDKDIAKILTDSAGEITGDLVDQFNQKLTANREFKDQISKVLSGLPENQNLIVFVDELDRCRPTYAIELLERIKHLFSIKRLIFILSTDKEQLSHSICAVYGDGFEAKKYLDRFIDLDYSLREPNLVKYIDFSLKNYCSNQNSGKSNNLDSLSILIFFFAIRLKLKLRDINLLITRLALILLSFPKENSYFYPKKDLEYEPMLLTLLILRNYNYDLYKLYQGDSRDREIILKIISFIGKGISTSEVALSNFKTIDQDCDLTRNFIHALVDIFSFFVAFSSNHENIEEEMVKTFIESILVHIPELKYKSVTPAYVLAQIYRIKHTYNQIYFNDLGKIIDHIELSFSITINK